MISKVAFVITVFVFVTTLAPRLQAAVLPNLQALQKQAVANVDYLWPEKVDAEEVNDEVQLREKNAYAYDAILVADTLNRKFQIGMIYLKFLDDVQKFDQGNTAVVPKYVCKTTKRKIDDLVGSIIDGADIDEFGGLSFDTIENTLRHVCGNWFTRSSEIRKNFLSLESN